MENHELRAFLDEHEEVISEALDQMLREQASGEHRGATEAPTEPQGPQ